MATIGTDNVISSYFNGLIQAVQQLEGHVLPHLDAVMRHYPELQFKPSHWNQIEKLLQLMCDNGIHLELNTSGYSLRNAPFPSFPIVRRALELGITLIAGSDAHHPEQVGRDFDRLPDFLNP